jgi:hypothetical protein
MYFANGQSLILAKIPCTNEQQVFLQFDISPGKNQSKIMVSQTAN